MKERGILFSAPMVRALLEGSKTQTRRALKGIAPEWRESASMPELVAQLECPYGQPGDRLWVRETFFAFGRWETRYNARKNRDEWYFIDMTLESGRTYQYAAEPLNVVLAAERSRGAPAWHKRPAIFMPRVASRLLLEVASVRVEPLNDCSEADAAAEGWQRDAVSSDDPAANASAARAWYHALWEQINGVGSWDANPLVWVVEFRRVKP